MESVTDYTTQCPDAKCNGKIFNWETSTYDDCPYSYHNECEEVEEEEDKDAMQCYSVKNINRREYCVASNLFIIVDFDEYGEQCAVYKNNDCNEIYKKLIVTYNKHDEEFLKLVPEDYELNDEKNESFVTFN